MTRCARTGNTARILAKTDDSKGRSMYANPFFRFSVLAFLMQAWLVAGPQAALADQGVSEPDIAIDVPVHLKTAKVLFDASRPDFAGDVPVALKYMKLMTEFFEKEGTKGQIVGVFYGDTAYMMLEDSLYNARRGVTSGNPYKTMIAELQKAGVRFEICVKAMSEQNIRRQDLLPGVLVNAGANLRMVALMQQGFVRLQP